MFHFRRTSTCILRLLQSSLFFLSVVLLSSCGGGSTRSASASPGTGGTGSYTIGPITGFGSVIINGVRYNDASAVVRTEDGDSSDDDKGLLDLNDLKLGMITSVVAGAETPAATSADLATATASVFYLSNELKGPVSRIDSVANTVTVLAQTIRTTGSTVFANVASLAQATSDNCRYAEIYAYYDTSDDSYTATRIECIASTRPPPSFRIFGPARNVTASGFSINGLTIDRGTESLAGIADGILVRAQLGTSLSGTANNIATAIRLRTHAPSSVREFNEGMGEANVQGLIDRYVSDAEFSVNGVAVMTSSSTRFESGVARPLYIGLRIEVEGSFANGTLMAREVEIEAFQSQQNTGKFIGKISNFSATSKTFSLVTSSRQSKVFIVDYSTAVFEKSSDLSRLANGVTAEIFGNLAANERDIQATMIEVED